MRMSARGFVIGWIFAACATGGTADNQKSDAPVDHHDAQRQQFDAPVSHADASQQSDAAMQTDAPVQQVDGGGGGGICSDNTQCTAAGQCCFVALCVNGTAIGVNFCIPM
jgi:hypothetical protein